MTPLRALRSALAVDTSLDDETPARDAAVCALRLTGRDARQAKAMRRSLTSCLFVERRTVDVRAAMSGGVRGDDGDVLRIGGAS